MDDLQNFPKKGISLRTYIELEVAMSKIHGYRSPYLIYGHVPEYVILPEDLQRKKSTSNRSTYNPFSQKFQIIYRNNGFYHFVLAEK